VIKNSDDAMITYREVVLQHASSAVCPPTLLSLSPSCQQTSEPHALLAVKHRDAQTGT